MMDECNKGDNKVEKDKGIQDYFSECADMHIRVGKLLIDGDELLERSLEIIGMDRDEWEKFVSEN